MQHHGQGGGIPRLVGYAIGNLSVEGETEGNTQLGETPNNEEHQIVSGVREVLSPLCFETCGDSSSINVFDEEGCRDAVGSSSAAGVLAVKGRLVRCADPSLPGS